jgi:hypothetical protein
MKRFKSGMIMFLSVIIMSLGFHSLIVMSEEGDVDGEFTSKGFNNDAEVQAVRLFEVDGSTSTAINAGQSLQPRNTYRIEIDIFDFDSVNDLDTLEIRFFYVSTGTSVGAAFDGATTTPDDGSALVLTFTNDSNGGSFALTTNAAVTWELLSSTVPSAGVTDQAFTFEVEFRISKVAQFTEDLEWHLGLVVTDGFLAEGADLRTVTYAGIDLGSNPLNGTTATFNMNWYGEIDVPSSARVSWPVLLPGSGFDSPNNNATIPAITYIANGGFARQINSDLNWLATQGGIENVPDATLNLNTNVAIETTQTPQTFSLKVNETEDANYQTDPGDAQFILTSFQETGLLNQGTTEAGVEFKYEVFIALSRNFQNATYEGKITFLITNLLEVGA